MRTRALLMVLAFAVVSGLLGCSENGEAEKQPTREPEPQAVRPPSSQEEPNTSRETVTVYITRTGKKYHRGQCSYLRKSKIPIMLKEAKAQGYGPCSRCSPPR